jgi:hypothetical protein
MVAHIARAQRGHVAVESAPGRGGTCTITLPGPADGVRRAGVTSAPFNGGEAPPPPLTALDTSADAQGLAESPSSRPSPQDSSR